MESLAHFTVKTVMCIAVNSANESVFFLLHSLGMNNFFPRKKREEKTIN